MTGMSKQRVRDEIRAELAKQNPIESARGPLELIAETSICLIEDGGEIRYQVVDSEGKPRTKVKDGAAADLTIQDVVAELREAHPTLFRSVQSEDAKPAEPLDEQAPSISQSRQQAEEPAQGGARAPEPSAVSAHAGSPAEKTRDWLILQSSEPPPAAPSVPTVQRDDRSNGAQAKRSFDLKDVAARLRLAPDVFASKLRSIRTMLPEWRARTLVAPVASGLPSSRSRAVYGALAGVLALALVGYFMLGSAAQTPSSRPTAGSGNATASRTQPESNVTGTVPSRPQSSAPASANSLNLGPISGVPEIIDTSTLRIDGKVVRLFGVEWARGGQPEDLSRYLRNREVTCRPAPAADTYRCQVDGRDVSEVVLYNGGARTTPNATSDLVAAENHARTERLGIWRK